MLFSGTMLWISKLVVSVMEVIYLQMGILMAVSAVVSELFFNSFGGKIAHLKV